MDRFAVYDEHGRPLALEDLPSVRLLAGEPRRRAAARAQRRARDPRGALAAAQVLGAARRGRRDPAGRQRDRERHGGQARRARAAAARATPARRSPPRWTPSGSSARSCGVLVPALADWAALELPDERGEPRPRGARPATDAGGRRRRRAARSRCCAGAEALGTLTLAHARAVRGASARRPRARGGDRPPRRRGGLNARSHTRRTAIARALQHGLLPPELPDVPGWSAAGPVPAGRRVQRGRRRLLRRLRRPARAGWS